MRAASGETAIPFSRSAPSGPPPGSATSRDRDQLPSWRRRAIVPLPRLATYRSEPPARVVLLEKAGFADLRHGRRDVDRQCQLGELDPARPGQPEDRAVADELHADDGVAERIGDEQQPCPGPS